jgi:hypothetical protein
MSSLADAFIEHERRAAAEVAGQTWGHLAPRVREPYRGWLLFAYSAYEGSAVLLDAEWDGLDDSPWLYEDMQEFIRRPAVGGGERCVPGGVYRFEGTYTKRKNGRAQFRGTTRRAL